MHFHPTILNIATFEISQIHFCRCGSGGIFASLFTHTIGLNPIVLAGSEEMKNAMCADVITGKKKICLAITEAGGGSDVANVRTIAEKQGVLNGFVISWLSNILLSCNCKFAN